MDYPPPGGQYSNDPNAPGGVPDYGRPPYAPDGPTDPQRINPGHASPPMPPPQQYGGYAPTPTRPGASFGGYPPPPPVAPSGPMPNYGGYAPPQPYPGYPPYAQPFPPGYYPGPHSQDNTTALVLEAVCSVFGLYGIGWLFRGRVGIGIALLAAGFAWVGFALFVTIFTAFLGLLCLGPLHLLLVVGDVLMLNNSLRQQ